MSIWEWPVFSSLERSYPVETHFRKQSLFYLLLKCHPYPEGTDCVYFLKVLPCSKLLTVIVIKEKVNKFRNA